MCKLGMPAQSPAALEARFTIGRDLWIVVTEGKLPDRRARGTRSGVWRRHPSRVSSTCFQATFDTKSGHIWARLNESRLLWTFMSRGKKHSSILPLQDGTFHRSLISH